MFKAFGDSRRSIVLLLALATIACWPPAAQAQEGPPPRLPPGPQPPPGPTQGPFGAIASENYLVSSSANEHGSYLWIVAPIQHVVVLCEKLDAAKDFTCTMKRLP